MNKSLLTLALTAALAGCSLIPEYQRPAAPVEASWPQALSEAGDAQALTLDWQAFIRIRSCAR